MRLSTQGPVAAAMAATLASAATGLSGGAAPVDLDLPNGLDLSKPINAGLSLDIDISHTTLLAGVVAHAAVGDIAEVGAGVGVGVVCQDCYVKGAIDASLSLENVVPALRLDLSDIEVKLDLDIHLDAGVTVAVRLPIPETHLSLPLPELDVGVSLYLELVIGADTAIDVSAGVFAQLLEDAFLETNILDGKIVNAAFNGLAINVLPIEVRIGCTELLIDLKLRAEVAVKADVELDEILPLEQLGLDIIPDIGAGIQAAVAVDLFEYLGLFCNDPQCPLGKESTGLSIAAAAKVNVDIEDILDIPIELLVGTKLLSLPPVTICEPSYPTGPVPTLSATTAPGGGVPGYPTGVSGNSPVTTPAPSGYTTTVITGTQTFTATVCDQRVANCPGAHQTGTTIVHTTVYTTTCPGSQTGPITALPPAPTHESLPPVTITKHVTTLVPCSEVTTYTPHIGTTPVPGVPTASVPPAVSTTAETSPVFSVPTTAPVRTPSFSVPPTAPVQTPSFSVPTTAPVQTPSFSVPTTAPTAPYPGLSTSTIPAVPFETPSTFPVEGPSSATESCSTTPATTAETSPIFSVPTTAPVQTPSFSVPTTAPVQTPSFSVPTTAPVQTPSFSVPTTAPTAPYPGLSTSTVPAVPFETPSFSVPTTAPVQTPSFSVPTTAPVQTPSFSVPTTAPTAPYPGPSTTAPVVPVEAPSYPAEGPSTSVPVKAPSTISTNSPETTAPVEVPSNGYATVPAEGPSTISTNSPETAPVEAPSNGYATASVSSYPPRATYPAEVPETYPAGSPPAGSSTVSVPAESTSATSPVGAPGTTVPYPTGPSYPTIPAGHSGSNPTPTTFTSAPSASLTYPTSSSPSGPATHTPVQVAGAGKMSTGVTGAVAAIMAAAALM